MNKPLNDKPDVIKGSPRPIHANPFPPRFVLEYLSLQEELRQVKQRLSELEKSIPDEKVVVLRNITREEAKREIQQLFSDGRTLYYSDIVQELGLDLKTVVDICNELEEEKVIGVDAGVSQKGRRTKS